MDKYQYHRDKYSHSKSQMTPVKITGVTMESTSIKRSVVGIPAITATRNGLGFKSVDTNSKSFWVFIYNADSSKYTNYKRDASISQREIIQAQAQERITDFKNFWVFGNKNNVIFWF